MCYFHILVANNLKNKCYDGMGFYVNLCAFAVISECGLAVLSARVYDNANTAAVGINESAGIEPAAVFCCSHSLCSALNEF